MTDLSPDLQPAADIRGMPPVELPSFTGPLDLLLHLVRKNRVAITDIPIATICDQYQAELRAMVELDLEVAGEYVVMAAWLLYVKSRTLLPRAEEEAEDPRAELVERLLEYRRVKEVASLLYEQDVVRRCLWTPTLERGRETSEAELDWQDVDLRVLAKTYLDVLQRFAVANPPPLIVVPLRYTVADKIRELYARVLAEGLLPLRRLMARNADPEEVVTIVVAALELARIGGVLAEQARPFAEVYLRIGRLDLDVDALLRKGGAADGA